MKKIVQLVSQNEKNGEVIDSIYPITLTSAIKTNDDKTLEEFLDDKIKNTEHGGLNNPIKFNDLLEKPFNYVETNIMNNKSLMNNSKNSIALGKTSFIGNYSVIRKSVWSKTTNSIQIQKTEDIDLQACKILLYNGSYSNDLNFFDLIEDYTIDNESSTSTTTISFTNVELPQEYLSLEAFFIKDGDDIKEIINSISIGYANIINNDFSIANGYANLATGKVSSAFGFKSESSGDYSYANGYQTKATADFSCSQGYYTTASGKYSHAECNSAVAKGDYSHAEGSYTEANGTSSHAEGYSTNAIGNYSHTEGYNSKSTGDYSHSEGYATNAKSKCSHAEGYYTIANGDYSHTEGYKTQTDLFSNYSHAEGALNFVASTCGHAEGNSNFAGSYKIIADITANEVTYDTYKINNTGLDIKENDFIVVKKGYYFVTTISSIVNNTDTIDLKVNDYIDSNLRYGKEILIIRDTNFSTYCTHTEGLCNIAAKDCSHAEGSYNFVDGQNSHAEGANNTIITKYSHAEGYNNNINAENGHAEGSAGFSGNYLVICTVENAIDIDAYTTQIDSSFIGEIKVDDFVITLDDNIYSHRVIKVEEGVDSVKLTLSGYFRSKNFKVIRFKDNGSVSSSMIMNTHTEGRGTIAINNGSHAEGITTLSSGQASHAEGLNTQARGVNSHAEGNGTVVTGYYAHAEGHETQAFGSSSHAEGVGSKTSGQCAHAEGEYTIASGVASHAEGYRTQAKGHYSHAAGYETIAQQCQTVVGKYNIEDNNSLFIVGYGDEKTRGNLFRVHFSGNVYAKGSVASNGADYAEMFEWADGNINNEDRVGYFVTFEKGTDKIKIANSNDEYILGVISATASIIGDRYEDEWNEKYLTDDFGRVQYEEKIINDEITFIPKLNKKYNADNKYVSRSNRKEWDSVGMLGKIFVLHDGTCNIGDYCSINDNGIATKSENGYYVIDKTNTTIKILFK